MKFMKSIIGLIIVSTVALLPGSGRAQTNPPLVAATNAVSYAPAVLPGKGLAQHPFLLTGEADSRNKEQTLFVVRDGKVAWTYSVPLKTPNGESELGDATMLSNGNIVFCRRIGASEVTPDKKIIWNMDAPKGTEIHSIQPIGLDRVLVTVNGHPPKLMLINIKTGATEKELTLPAARTNGSPHLQFRRVHQTAAGTYLAAHLMDNKVSEYDADGKQIWTYAVSGPWSATRLKNGNTLIAANRKILEVNHDGDVVWDFSPTNAPDYKMFIFQEVSRLANGNTVVCSWCPGGIRSPTNWPGSVQVLEISPEKKIVWALSQWKDPDLGPASSIQLLDEPSTPENPGDQQR
jgi:hypothetical protein